MHPATRTQRDDKQDRVSYESGLDCESAPNGTGKSVTRQEDKDEADINLLLQRYGVGVPQRPVQFGETNFSEDLQAALEAIRTARTAYRKLTPEQRREYPSWGKLLHALETGKLSLDKTEEKSDPAPTPKPEAK